MLPIPRQDDYATKTYNFAMQEAKATNSVVSKRRSVAEVMNNKQTNTPGFEAGGGCANEVTMDLDVDDNAGTAVSMRMYWKAYCADTFCTITRFDAAIAAMEGG